MWNPADWITDFATAYRTIEIPELTDPVLGITEPVAPIAFSSLPDYSASQFANMANNSYYNELRFVDDDVVLSVGNETELLAAKDWLSRRTVLIDGAEIEINITASFSSDQWPISFVGIVGEGTIIIDGNDYTLTDTSSGQYHFAFEDCTVPIIIEQIVFADTGASGQGILYFRNCTAVDAVELTFNTPSTNFRAVRVYETKRAYFESCTFNDDYSYDFWIEASYVEFVDCYFGSCVTAQMRLRFNSHVWIDDIDVSTFKANDAASYAGIMRDISSTVSCDSFGGGSNLVTFTNTASTLMNDLNRFLNFLPKRINQDIRIKLPATTIGPIPILLEIAGFWGEGSLLFEANTLKVPGSFYTDQDTVFYGDDNAIWVHDNYLWLDFDSFEIYSDDDNAIQIEDSRGVSFRQCYIHCSTTLGNAMDVYQSDNIWVNYTVFGDCVSGIVSWAGSIVNAIVNDDNGGGDQPSQYGYAAYYGGYINHDTSFVVTGVTGTTIANTGGMVNAS